MRLLEICLDIANLKYQIYIYIYEYVSLFSILNALYCESKGHTELTET